MLSVYEESDRVSNPASMKTITQISKGVDVSKSMVTRRCEYKFVLMMRIVGRTMEANGLVTTAVSDCFW